MEKKGPRGFQASRYEAVLPLPGRFARLLPLTVYQVSAHLPLVALAQNQAPQVFSYLEIPDASSASGCSRRIHVRAEWLDAR